MGPQDTGLSQQHTLGSNFLHDNMICNTWAALQVNTSKLELCWWEFGGPVCFAGGKEEGGGQEMQKLTSLTSLQKCIKTWFLPSSSFLPLFSSSALFFFLFLIDISRFVIASMRPTQMPATCELCGSWLPQHQVSIPSALFYHKSVELISLLFA